MKARSKPHATGWRPDLPDVRDHLYAASIHHANEKAKALPAAVDLSTSPHMPPIADQGQLGSCTAFATCAAFDYLDSTSGQPFESPSHLFQYYNSRALEHTTSEDAGSSIRDAIKVTGSDGMCHETLWPYNIAKFRTKPTKPCFADAKHYVVSQYLRVDSTSLIELKTCLAAGFPIVFGATLYASFEQPGPNSRGEIPMPKNGEQILGGHAQVIVGYDDARKMFKVRNSWGASWGVHGHEWMPYAYLTNLNLADDFWTLRKLA
jgi:C1A family cysteine protease